MHSTSLFHGDAENAHIHAVYLTTTNLERDLQKVSCLCMIGFFMRIKFKKRFTKPLGIRVNID